MGDFQHIEGRRLPGKIDSPRFEELENEFVQSGGEWQKVRIGELFEIHPTKNYGITNTKLFEKKGKTPVIVNSSFNNGVGGYVDLQPLEKGGIITFSDTTTSDSIFYQKQDFIGYSHVQGMYPYDKVKWTDNSLIYVCIAFRKSTKGLFDYGNKFNRDKAKEMIITLPFLNGELCFSYMERYIAKVELAHLEALDAYLQNTGVKDCELSFDEMQVLERFEKPSTVKTGSFLLGDIFNITSSKQKFNADSLNFGGKYPYIARGESNNGVRGYIDEDKSFLNDGNTISFGQDTATMFYQAVPYFTGDKIKVLRAKGFTLNRYLALYAIATTKKMLNTFSWGSTSYKLSNLENIEIELPIKTEGDTTPDYCLMQTFIKVMEKLVIKDVVDWLNERIEEIKDMIQNNSKTRRFL